MPIAAPILAPLRAAPLISMQRYIFSVYVVIRKMHFFSEMAVSFFIFLEIGCKKRGNRRFCASFSEKPCEKSSVNRITVNFALSGFLLKWGIFVNCRGGCFAPSRCLDCGPNGPSLNMTFFVIPSEAGGEVEESRRFIVYAFRARTAALKQKSGEHCVRHSFVCR